MKKYKNINGSARSFLIELARDQKREVERVVHIELPATGRYLIPKLVPALRFGIVQPGDANLVLQIRPGTPLNEVLMGLRKLSDLIVEKWPDIEKEGANKNG